MRFKLFVLSCALLSALVLTSVSAFALPPLKPLSHKAWLKHSENLTEDLLQRFDFTGIIALSNCSASLVQFSNSMPNDPALMMTNGHCLGGLRMLRPGEVVVNRRDSRWAQFLNADGRPNGARLNATKIIFATMTKTDLAIYELNKTYAQVREEYGAEPLLIADFAPSSGTEIEVLSGYWRRGYSCSVEYTVDVLREADWTFNQSIRYSRPGCETIGGTSGSPIVATGTRIAVGVNNTSNESGRECTLNNPCEVSSTGEVTVEKGVSYGQQIHWLVNCFNSMRKLDLSLPNCELPKP